MIVVCIAQTFLTDGVPSTAMSFGSGVIFFETFFVKRVLIAYGVVQGPLLIADIYFLLTVGSWGI